jgi:hypothetical protein
MSSHLWWILPLVLIGVVVIGRMIHYIAFPSQEKLEILVLTPLDPVPHTSSIPHLVHMTYHDLALIPDKVYTNLQTYAPEYSLQLYDDARALDFLRTHFQPLVSECFLRTRRGAHKADLLRYCLLYVYGGVYLDIKTELVRPLRDLFRHPEVTVYMVLDYDPHWVWSLAPRIYNGILATVPRNDLFLRLVYNFVQTSRPWYYHIFVRQCYLALEQELEEPVQTGRVLQGRSNRVYLFHQRCSTQARECHDGLDRYGLCCFVWDQDAPAFKVRYSDFPWSVPKK